MIEIIHGLGNEPKLNCIVHISAVQFGYRGRSLPIPLSSFQSIMNYESTRRYSPKAYWRREDFPTKTRR